MTSCFVKCLPETAGKALGNFDVPLKGLLQPSSSGHTMSSGQQQLSSSNSSSILSSSSSYDGDDDVAVTNETTGSRFSGGDQIDEGGDERNISSFEII
jgi:hypothetical protein